MKSLTAAATVVATLFSTIAAPAYNTHPCLQQSAPPTLQDLVACLHHSVIPADYLTETTYAEKSPPASWATLVTTMLNATSFALSSSCASIVVPKDIAPDVQVVQIWDRKVGKSYCVVLERNVDKRGKFVKGWGVFVVPERVPKGVKGGVHVQAPHPVFESGNSK
ncbi:hypothetical protein HK104_005143 [Borealophlyctis nickersoniae]|nr:hypothetical protein HK104_005143 [Borealophlyctis nickersoniae]